MMKYKFKIGDKVVVIKRLRIGPEKNYWGELVGKTFIVTERSKSQLGNQYELTNNKNDNSFAWVYEEQMEFERVIDGNDLENLITLQKNFEQEERKKNIEFNNKMIESMKTMTPIQREATMSIFFPISYGMMKAAQKVGLISASQSVVSRFVRRYQNECD